MGESLPRHRVTEDIPFGIPQPLRPFARELALPRAGVKLFYYDAGPADAPPMILVHGLGDEADTWRRVIVPLSYSFRVIAADLPGFGRSTLPVRRRPLSPPFLAGVMRELVEQLGIPSATWVGSSLGAGIAQLVALTWPARAARLVLVDGGIQSRPGFRGALGMLVPGPGERRYRSFRENPEAAYDSLRPYYGNLDTLPAAERKFLRERVLDRVSSDTQRKAYFSVYRSLVLWILRAGRGATRRVRLLDPKSLYVWGSADRIIPIQVKNTRKARVAIVPGAGHLPHQESPEEFLGILREFTGQSAG